VLALYPLALFRSVFEFGFSKSSRAAEFAADQLAARLTSAQAIATSLIKVAAYASYRSRVENDLFSSANKHEGQLAIADRIAQGLSAFAATADFQSDLLHGSTPHPFDTHPPMQQRIQAVGANVPATQYAQIATEAVTDSWVNYMPHTAALEQRLWDQFEQAFAGDHALSLAYRYVPNTPEERAHVLKHFPGINIPAKKGQLVVISIDGIQTPDNHMQWQDLQTIQYHDGTFGFSDKLVITHPANSPRGKTTTLKLPIAASERPALQEALEKYWHRHRVMCSQVRE
jgi:Peptidase family M48